ncbi:MAG: YceI family protein [Chloroflexia bacterium]
MANTTPETQEQTVANKTWTIDPSHTSVSFSAKHMMVSTVRGHLGPISGAIEIDDTDFTKSEIEVVIDIANLQTRDEKRDAHLKSGDFFDVENFPSALFKSTRIESLGGEKYSVVGNLSVRGTTKEITLDTQFEGFTTNPWGMKLVAFTATAKINRKDWGLNWNVALEAGGVLVGDQIKLDIDVEAIKQS